MFTHLHLHSEYSLLDGACRIRDIPKAAKALGQTSVAITDHGNMYGTVDFYRACKAEGIKPIIGCEVYVAQGSRFDKQHDSDSTRYHLVLLCKNETGYKNLSYMVSKAFTEGFYTKPRVDMELISSHSEGLICLSGCLQGYIPRAIARGDFDEAENYAVRMNGIFGDGNFYLELQDHGTELQKNVNRAILDIHSKTNIPMVCTNDVHYVKKSDADTQALLMCIQMNEKITNGRPLGFETDEFYMKSEEEMKEIFSGFEGAIENTQIIADRCNFDFDFSKLYLPRFTVPTDETPEEYLRRLSHEGFERRIKEGAIVFTEEHPEKEYTDRIEYELSVITRMGYSEYYLIVADFIGYAKRSHIPVGPGRGSGAASIVAYLIGITEVNPIEFGLMFERFLNPERISMPDFDTDFCDEQRGKVIEYVTEKYGKDYVCGITTFGTLSAKAVIRDVGRALGMSYSETDAVAKTIPYDLHITLEKALDGSLGQLYRNDPQVRRLVDIAMSLEGMPRNASAHAAGIVITDRPVYEYVPLSVNSGMTLTQFPMTTIADLGLLKFDFLGLRYLTIIADAEKEIKRKDPSFDIEKIPLDDEATYKLISAGKTDGLFQLESGGMKKMLCRMEPKNIEDIVLAIAIYRPGPMESIPAFLENRAHPENIKYKVPALKKILDTTSGCIIYQEQVMQICREVAGFSFGRADIIRRAMSKKHGDEMENERHAFIFGDRDKDGNVICEGAVANGISEEDASDIFDTLSRFASYAFNKAHAAAYAIVTYRTAYLKAHYPCEFLASLLSSVFGNLPKTAVYMSEAQKSKIKVLPPDINESFEKYTVVTHEDGKAIRFGLLGVKNIGLTFLSAIVNERQTGGLFRSFADFIDRMSGAGLNKSQIESLVRSGAFDSFGVNRSMLLAEYDKVVDLYVSRNRSRNSGQMDFFSMDGEDGSPKEEYSFTFIPEISLRDKIRMEKESTGMYFSGHPTDDFKDHIEYLGCAGISALNASFDENSDEHPYRENQTVTVSGIITSRTDKKTRKDEKMAFVTIEDRYGEIELIVFPKVFNECSYMLSPDMPIAATGKISVNDEGVPKILVNSVILLSSKFKAPEKDEPVKQEPAAKPKQQTLYIKVASMEGETFDRITALLEIFPGSTPVVFYDAKNQKYIKANSLSVSPNGTMINLLREISGKENIVLR